MHGRKHRDKKTKNRKLKAFAKEYKKIVKGK